MPPSRTTVATVVARLSTIRFDSRAVSVAVVAAATAIAVVGWLWTIVGAEVADIDDVGLISAIPPTAFVFVALLSVAFAASLRLRPMPTPLVILQIGGLIFILYGAPSIIEEMPRFITAWRHLGFAEAISRTSDLFPLRDARFDWPVFFIVGAVLVSMFGTQDLLGFINWIPSMQVALYVPPLFLLFSTATADRRLVWLAIWFFCLANWVGQDYYSPQGFNLLLYLTILAVLLAWFGRTRMSAWLSLGLHRTRLARWLTRLTASTDPDRSMLSNRQQMGLVAGIGMLFGLSVASHQLTPFAIVGATIGLTLIGRLRLSGLPLLMIVLLGSWLMFMASTYLGGHLGGLLDDIGSTEEFATSNVVDRLGGSAGHLFIVQARLVFTVIVWLTAVAGAVRRLRAGRIDLSFAVLAISPFALIFVQGYGGEMLLRVYLFTLAFTAFLGACAFFPSSRPHSWQLSIIIVIVSIAMSGGLFLTRYGNELADLVTTDEYRAAERLAQLAQPGDTLAQPNWQSVISYTEWDQHHYLSLTRDFRGDPDAFQALIAAGTRPGQNAYVIVSRGHRAHAEVYWGMPDAEYDRRVAALVAGMDLVYENPDARIFKWRLPVGGL